jgi:hypothetical protein
MKLMLSAARTTALTVALGTWMSCGRKESAIVQQPATKSSSSRGE